MKVVKFGAVWCPGCLIMGPRWKKIEADHSWLEAEYFDFDKDKQAVAKYNITDRLPCFIFLNKQNQEITRLTGEIPEYELVEFINKHKDD
ncbi:MAG: thioredoxin family protein [bacterium]